MTEKEMLSAIETILAEYPVFQYGFLKSREIVFSDRVRYICKTECGRYGRSWSCPPAVGKVEECRKRCLAYTHVLLFTTLAEVSDMGDMQETLAVRAEHEKIVRSISRHLTERGIDHFALSSESCALCSSCAYPNPCRHRDYMLPCIESQGILVTAAAEACGMEYFYDSSTVTWYGMIFFGRNEQKA